MKTPGPMGGFLCAFLPYGKQSLLFMCFFDIPSNVKRSGEAYFFFLFFRRQAKTFRKKRQASPDLLTFECLGI
jgi:hypothetical protein